MDPTITIYCTGPFSSSQCWTRQYFADVRIIWEIVVLNMFFPASKSQGNILSCFCSFSLVQQKLMGRSFK